MSQVLEDISASNNDSSNALVYIEGEQVICKDQIFDVVVWVRCEVTYVINVQDEKQRR